MSTCEQIRELMEAKVAEKSFTAWAVANNKFAISAYYADEWLPSTEPMIEKKVSLHANFDLASLTKPLFTNLLLREKLQQFGINLRMPLNKIIENSEFFTEYIKDYSVFFENNSLETLLNHESGLPPWFWFGSAFWEYYDKGLVKAKNPLAKNFSSEYVSKIKKTLLTKCCNLYNSNLQSNKQTYSDLNYLFLCLILENMQSNTKFNWQEELAKLNQKLNTNLTHCAVNKNKYYCALPSSPYLSMELLAWDGMENNYMPFGEVHDTNQNILTIGNNCNIVSGHAGLFGSCLDVYSCLNYLCTSQNILENELNIEYSNVIANQQRFILGLDTPSSSESLAALVHWPLPKDNKVYGHLGYTGTSFWFSTNKNFDNTNSNKQVILTNRTAHRKELGVEVIPRIIVQSDFSSGLDTYFIQSRNGKFNECSYDDVYSLLKGISLGRKIVWDSSYINAPANINNLRRDIGKLLWV